MRKVKFNDWFFGLIVFSILITNLQCSAPTEEKSTPSEEKNEQPVVPASTNSNLNSTNKKREMLQSLVGERKLKSIAAMMGANSMVDIQHKPEVDKWTGSGSINLGGQREPLDINISPKQADILNSCRIIVEKDLSVYLQLNNKKILTIPFNDNSLLFSLKKPVSEIIGLPENITQNSIIVDNNLYLALTDRFDPTISSLAEIPGVFSEIILLKYNIESKRFEMIMLGYEFSGMATFFFNG
jgi:hypothetical protein